MSEEQQKYVAESNVQVKAIVERTTTTYESCEVTFLVPNWMLLPGNEGALKSFMEGYTRAYGNDTEHADDFAWKQEDGSEVIEVQRKLEFNTENIFSEVSEE
jgi:hypothetical protein